MERPNFDNGNQQSGKFYVKNMGLYVLMGRPNVGEKRSYPILIYQSKNNMGQSEFQIKCIIQKLLY